MSGVQIAATIEGVRRATTALLLARDDVRARVVVVVARSTKAVEAGAKARVAHRTDELANTIRSEISSDGLIGFVEAGFGSLKRSRGKRGRNIASLRGSQQGPVAPGIYAAVVEFGDAKNNKPAEPYMFPAFDAEKPEFAAGVRAALSGAEQAASAGGGA